MPPKAKTQMPLATKVLHPIAAQARSSAAALAAKPSIRWHAFYEDFEKAKRAATAEGYTGKDNEDVSDFVEVAEYVISRDFEKLNPALAWLLEAINSRKTSYGVGELRAQERPDRRCRYCNCEGWIDRTAFLVDDEGIAEETLLDSPCCD